QYNLSYFKEDKPLGTAGSLYLLKNKINTTFFVSNCDIVIEQDYREIYEYHKENGNLITLVASIKSSKIPYGTVESGENGELVNLKEKPELAYMVNSGMYILEPSILKYIPENMFYNITDLIDRVKNDGGRVGVFPVSEKSWLDIGEWPEYQKVLEYSGYRLS
ncbi:MAG: sugar phosphate nucleotidyltransferase, partial [Cyclobacteriaceae bacterium]